MAQALASVDIGTNTVLMLCARRAEGGAVQVLAQRGAVTRLGQGVEASGQLDPAAVARTLAALGEQVALARAMGAARVAAVGTQALREAGNAELLLGPAAELLVADDRAPAVAEHEPVADDRAPVADHRAPAVAERAPATNEPTAALDDLAPSEADATTAARGDGAPAAHAGLTAALDHHAPARTVDFTADLALALRGLGVAPADARDAIARSAGALAVTLEQRMRAALRALRTTYANRVREPVPTWGR